MEYNEMHTFIFHFEVIFLEYDEITPLRLMCKNMFFLHDQIIVLPLIDYIQILIVFTYSVWVNFLYIKLLFYRIMKKKSKWII